MGRFVVYTNEDYESVEIKIDSNKIEIETKEKPMEQWTSERLVKEFKKAHKKNNKRKMGKIIDVLHKVHGQDIYAEGDKIHLLTYNGCYYE